MKNTIVIIAISLFAVSCKNAKQSSYNEAASVLRVPSLDFNPLEGRLISSGVDTAQQLMYTLYGNPVAVNHARFHSATAYPAGSVLSKVTWRQQPDPHWFGANIPSSVSAVEVVRFITGSDGIVKPGYRHYSGDGSGADAVLSQAETEARINSIISVRASVMP
ncbi:MAG: hypothetical protein DI535_21090 [Citrobacter freundii]|nr:MAG: hypothetical protein DI535_21090 [Citrobacter freundii]